MRITLRLTPEMEHKLKEAAARDGLTLEEYHEWLVAQSVAAGGGTAGLDAEAWETAWRAWAASPKRLAFVAADDRESIYARCGE